MMYCMLDGVCDDYVGKMVSPSGKRAYIVSHISNEYSPFEVNEDRGQHSATNALICQRREYSH